jgi:tetratricopeptide (TPR) repeat protein
MSEREHIKQLVRQGDLYRVQGLLEDSIEKYQELLQFIQSHERFSKDKKIMDAITTRIRMVEEDLVEVDQEDETPELSEDVQDLIKKLFAFSKDKQTSAVEGAIALAKFGQHDKALAEFERLLRKGIMPLEVGKNILRWHFTFSSPDAAVMQFKLWVSRDELSKEHLKYLRDFLENILEKRGIQADLPEVLVAPHEKDHNRIEIEVEKSIDISSIAVQLPRGPLKGETAEFEVSFQSGNTISFIIPADEKELVESFRPNLRLEEIQCYSQIAVFNTSGVVTGNTRITSGPRRQDYSLDITIDEGSS